MNIRKLTQKDMVEASHLLQVAFEQSIPQPVDQWAEQVLKNPKQFRERHWLERWGAFEDGKLISSMASYPYTVYFDGTTVKMGGVGDVCTYPHYRNRGAVRRLFQTMFEETNNRGDAFSYLFPFSTAYYSQFGYVPGCRSITWNLQLDELKKISAPGTIERYEPGQPVSDYMAVYEKVARSFNFMVKREELHWKPFIEADPYQEKRYTYLYRESGVPKAYVTFRKEQAAGQTVMACDDFVFFDAAGLYGLLNFSKKFAANYEVLRLFLPVECSITALLPELVDFQLPRHTLHFFGMARVINVRRVLENAAYLGSGSTVVKIVDDFCPWNDGVFSLCFQDGEFVSMENTNKGPDIDLPISWFTSLITGRHSLDDFDVQAALGKMKNIDILRRIFYPKKMYLMDHF